MEMITISKQTWEELKENPSFRELIEQIEDREALLTSREKTNSQDLQPWEDFKKTNPL